VLSCEDATVPQSPWPAQAGALVHRDAREQDLHAVVELRNDPAVNRFMLRTHVDPEAYR